MDSPITAPSNDTQKPPSGEYPNSRLDVSIEHDSYVAGQINIVRILLTNPYDEEIRLGKIFIPQSSSFQEHQEYKEHKDIGSHDDGKETSFWKKFSSLLLPVIPSFLVPREIVFGSISMGFHHPRAELVIKAESGAHVKVGRPLGDFDSILINAEDNSSIEFIDQKNEQPSDSLLSIVIHPRSTIVVPVSVKTNSWVLFTPQRFGLNVQITFSHRSIERSQVIATQMDIRPPLSSVLIGTVIGGALGSLVASLNRGNASLHEGIINMITSILMSIIAAISLSRRGSGQAFITVEDFYGAFFIGSLIGYGGVTYFERALMPTQSEGHGTSSG